MYVIKELGCAPVKFTTCKSRKEVRSFIAKRYNLPKNEIREVSDFLSGLKIGDYMVIPKCDVHVKRVSKDFALKVKI